MAEGNVQNRENGQDQRESPGIARREGPHAMRKGWSMPSLRRADLFNPNPFAMMRRLNEEIDRAFGWQSMGGNGQSEWMPAIDVSERDGELRVHADLPGIDRENVNVEVSNNVLTISGERRQEHEENEGGYHRMERSYGSFSRSIALPDGAQIDQAHGEFKNGVLEICVPLPKAQQNSRQIPIQGGTSAQSQSESQSQPQSQTQNSSGSQESTASGQNSGSPDSRTGPQTADPASLGKEVASEHHKQGQSSKVA